MEIIGTKRGALRRNFGFSEGEEKNEAINERENSVFMWERKDESEWVLLSWKLIMHARDFDRFSTKSKSLGRMLYKDFDHGNSWSKWEEPPKMPKGKHKL